MNKKMLFMGIMVVILLFGAAGNVFAQNLVADLGDVRIYSMGNGYFSIESDRTQQCFPLKFTESAGIIEVACSSYVRKAASSGVGAAVKYVVTAYLGGSAWAGNIAGSIANWAAGQGIDYLCR